MLTERTKPTSYESVNNVIELLCNNCYETQMILNNEATGDIPAFPHVTPVCPDKTSAQEVYMPFFFSTGTFSVEPSGRIAGFFGRKYRRSSGS